MAESKLIQRRFAVAETWKQGLRGEFAETQYGLFKMSWLREGRLVFELPPEGTPRLAMASLVRFAPDIEVPHVEAMVRARDEARAADLAGAAALAQDLAQVIDAAPWRHDTERGWVPLDEQVYQSRRRRNA